jgi:putative ubiquitin-RnfH superfamily antitoxin RatB of RatAB toxin-antitoxin module
MPEALSISVVYALPETQAVVRLDVPRGTTVEQAVELSQLVGRFPEIRALPLQCAVFGRHVPLTYTVRDGDRVEILRPLRVDPKEQRRRAAAKARKS